MIDFHVQGWHMAKNLSAFLSRREVARGGLLGGASVLLGATRAAWAEGPTAGSEFINVRQWGAAGDGKTDDTKALQRALDAAGEAHSAVFVPAGVYLCADLQMHPNTALFAVPTWDYRSGGGTVLRLNNPDASCLLNIAGAWGATIDGLAFDGAGLGKGIHGVFLNKPAYSREDAFRIERCQVRSFSGDGLNLTRAWCFSVRHCMLAYNHGDGLRLRGWDGFLVDNWFSANGGAGFGAREENASVTFTDNRIEWNHQENMVITGCDGYQITGNFFDRAGTCGIALRNGKQPCAQITITGNYFKRNGKLANPDSYDSSQIMIEGAHGVTCVGNNLWAGRDDGGRGVWSPSYGIVYKGLENCVISQNVLHQGALRQLMVDLGGHGDGVVIKDNPGMLLKPPPSP